MNDLNVIPEDKNKIFRTPYKYINRRFFIYSFVLSPFLQKIYYLSQSLFSPGWVCSEFFIECEPYKISKIIYPDVNPTKYIDLIKHYKKSNFLIHSTVDVKTSSNKVSIMYKKIFKNQKTCNSFITDYFSMHKYKDSINYFKTLKANKVKYTYVERYFFDYKSIHKQNNTKTFF